MKSPWHAPVLPTSQHERVYDLLRRLIGEGAANFFADACDIAQTAPPYRSATHIVGHLLRETEGQVLDVLTRLPKVPHDLRSRNQSNGHGKKVKAILDALELAGVAGAKIWLDYANADGAWFKSAHRNGLHAPRSPDEAFLERVDAFALALDIVLSRVESQYAPLLKQLDLHLAASPPSRLDIEAVASYMGTGVTALAHIFEKVDATWLDELRRLDAFSEPPDVHIRADGSYSFPAWPPAKYLIRIASQRADAVSATIESIPASRNQTVYDAFLQAATRMPPAEARRVARHVELWLVDQKWLNGTLSLQLPQLVEVLLDGSNTEHLQALDLLGAALALLPQDPDDRFGRPKARMSDFDYGELVRGTIPIAARKAPEATQKLLLQLLSRSGTGNSGLCRDTIDGHDNAGIDGPPDLIFSELRNAYLARAAVGAAELRSAVLELELMEDPLYGRLALHLLRVCGGRVPEMVVERLQDQARLSNHLIRHEMQMLARDQFDRLNAVDQSRVLEAIRRSCVHEADDTSQENASDGNRSAELGLYARRLLFEWWRRLGPDHPSAIVGEYQSLLAEFGEPDESRIQVGSRSPKAAALLLAMPDEELIAFLRNWAPEKGAFFGPSRRGLADEIKLCAGRQLERFAHLSRSFRGLSPPYVAALLWGIHEALQNNLSTAVGDEGAPRVDWDSLLDLGDWTVEQRTYVESHGADTDDWTAARRFAVEIAEHAALMLTPTDPPRSLRGWAILQRLVEDPNPPLERVAEAGREIAFAINTVRGQALEATIKLACRLGSLGASAPDGLLAEVMADLARRADPNVEPAGGIRCLLAMYFNDIHIVDPEFAAALRDKLFPGVAASGLERRAAWRVFLKYNASCLPTFACLRASYEASIDSVGEEKPRDALELGRHVVRLAVAHAIDLESGDNILKRFIARAPIEARRNTLAWLGDTTNHSKTQSAAVLSRLRLLWTWWVEQVRSGDASDLSAFGWWFASDALESEWSLPELERVLRLTNGEIERDDLVVKKLGGLVASSPGSVAACLHCLLDSSDEWWVMRTEHALRACLEALLSTSAADSAREIASRLVAMSNPRFQDLALSPPR